MKGVVLCADDFGLNAGVCRGILALAERGRISATNAMTNMPAWTDFAQSLKPLGERIGVGLHLNLTTGRPLAPASGLAPNGDFFSLQDLISKAFTGRLLQSEVRAEIDRQLDAFEGAFGVPPAFVDGHQHVQVLPTIRTALLQALAARNLSGRIWLRDPTDNVLAIVRREISSNKALIVKALAIGFRRAARNAGFETNDGFSGYSPFDPLVAPRTVFGAAFLELGKRPVIMAHPGVEDTKEAMEILTRGAELEYLASDAFPRDLQERGLVLVPRPQ